MLDGCASSFHPCHASDQHVDLRKKWNEDNQDVHFLISGEYDDHIVRLLILFIVNWISALKNEYIEVSCFWSKARNADLMSSWGKDRALTGNAPHVMYNIQELDIYNWCLLYIWISTIDVYCKYRALRARSDWVQSTDARISYASAPPLTNCHRSPNSMMFLDSGIKLASHTETILRILEMCFCGFWWLRSCSSPTDTETQWRRD